MENFIKALCEIFDTLSDSLTLQYFEDREEIWIMNTKTNNKLYMGNVYDIMDRAYYQHIKNEMEGEN